MPSSILLDSAIFCVGLATDTHARIQPSTHTHMCTHSKNHLTCKITTQHNLSFHCITNFENFYCLYTLLLIMCLLYVCMYVRMYACSVYVAIYMRTYVLYICMIVHYIIKRL